MPLVEKLRIETDHGDLEVCIGGGADSTAPTVCAAHPAEPLGENAVELLAAASGARVVRERLADPACLLSPFYPAWHAALEGAGLLDPESHREAGSADDAEWIEIQGVGAVWRRRNAVHEAIAASIWVAVEGAGHVPVVEKRGEVNAAVRSFLADQRFPVQGCAG